jgi:hypothetical protein
MILKNANILKIDAYCLVMIIRTNVTSSVLLTDDLLEHKMYKKSDLKGNKHLQKKVSKESNSHRNSSRSIMMR